MLKKPVIGALTALALLPAILAGCSAGSGSTPDPGSSAQAVGIAEAASKVNACMREKGYDAEDPASPEEGMRVSVPDGVDPEVYQKDLIACSERANPGAGDGGKATEFTPTVEEQRAFGTCMRKKGFADFPDDDAAQQAYDGAGKPGFDEASDSCFGTVHDSDSRR